MYELQLGPLRDDGERNRDFFEALQRERFSSFITSDLYHAAFHASKAPVPAEIVHKGVVLEQADEKEVQEKQKER